MDDIINCIPSNMTQSWGFPTEFEFGEELSHGTLVCSSELTCWSWSASLRSKIKKIKKKNNQTTQQSTKERVESFRMQKSIYATSSVTRKRKTIKTRLLHPTCTRSPKSLEIYSLSKTKEQPFKELSAYKLNGWPPITKLT